MRNHHTTRSSRMRAFEALEALLARSSAVHVKDADLGVLGSGCEIDIVAHVDVLGDSHTLACQVTSGEGPHSVRRALERLRSGMARLPGKVTPILVAPCFSREAQALCLESNAGFLDFEGNGSVGFGEVFISTRVLPCRGVPEHVPEQAKGAGGGFGGRAEEGFPPVRAGGLGNLNEEDKWLPCSVAGGWL
jgi:hypothetical protein